MRHQKHFVPICLLVCVYNSLLDLQSCISSVQLLPTIDNIAGHMVASCTQRLHKE